MSKYITALSKITNPEIVENISANAMGYDILLIKQIEHGRLFGRVKFFLCLCRKINFTYR